MSTKLNFQDLKMRLREVLHPEYQAVSTFRKHSILKSSMKYPVKNDNTSRESNTKQRKHKNRGDIWRSMEKNFC